MGSPQASQITEKWRHCIIIPQLYQCHYTDGSPYPHELRKQPIQYQDSQRAKSVSKRLKSQSRRKIFVNFAIWGFYGLKE